MEEPRDEIISLQFYDGWRAAGLLPALPGLLLNHPRSVRLPFRCHPVPSWLCDSPRCKSESAMCASDLEDTLTRFSLLIVNFKSDILFSAIVGGPSSSEDITITLLRVFLSFDCLLD